MNIFGSLERRLGSLGRRFDGVVQRDKMSNYMPVASAEDLKSVHKAHWRNVPSEFGPGTGRLFKSEQKKVFPVRRVPVHQIVGTQEHADPGRIEKYAKSFGAKGRSLPIAKEYNGKAYLSDEHHHTAAAIKAGHSHVSMHVAGQNHYSSPEVGE